MYIQLIVLFFVFISYVESSVGFPSSSYGGIGGYAKFAHYGNGYAGFNYQFTGLKSFTPNSYHRHDSCRSNCQISYFPNFDICQKQ